MTSELDRSKREKELRKAQEKRAREDMKQRRRDSKVRSRETASDRKAASRMTAAHLEDSYALRFMFLSSVIVIVVFLLFEALLWLHSGSPGDLDTHLLNMADNTLAFVIGLGALNAVTYYSQVRRARRDEIRAIVRHNRLLEPNIDMFVTRKNSMTTPSGEPVDQYTIRRDVPIGCFADMFEPSPIASDAGMSKIDMYAYQQKYLFRSFQKMIEEINFSFAPEAGDAAMEFISATEYGSSSLQALINLHGDENRTKRNALVKSIREESANPSGGSTKPELMSVMILKQTVRDQENALERYLEAVRNLGE